VNSTGMPSCASGYPRNVVIDLATAGGAMAAQEVARSLLIGSLLTVTGSGTCFASAEVLGSVSTQPLRGTVASP